MELHSNTTNKPDYYWISFLLIIVSAFVVRIWSFSFGLPFLYHADEPIIVNHALAYGSGDLNPHFFNIPPLTSYLLFLCYGFYFLAGKLTGVFHSTAEFIALFLNDPSAFYAIARFIFGVLAGTTTVVVLMQTARRFVSPLAALAAGGILAFNFLHARDSHYIYADIPLLLALGGAFHSGIKLMLNPGSKGNILAFGVLSGIAAAFKYNGVFIYAIFLPVLWQNPKLMLQRTKAVFWASILTVIVFFICNPFALIDFSFFAKELREQGAANTGAGVLHHLVYSLAGGVGVPILGLAILGFLGTEKNIADESKLATAMAASFVIVYYGVLIMKAQAYSRYVLPMIPFISFLAGCGLVRLGLGRHLFWLILVLINIFPASKIFAWNSLMGHSDTRTQARSWIYNNIPAGSSIALDWDFYMPRLNFSDEQLHEKLAEAKQSGLSDIQEKRIAALLQRNTQEPAYQISFLSGDPGEERFLFAKPVIAYSAEALREKGIEYAVIVETWRDRNYDKFYEYLKREAEEIAAFTPYRKPETRQIDRMPLTGGPFLTEEIFARRSNGPIIRIYKTGDDRA